MIAAIDGWDVSVCGGARGPPYEGIIYECGGRVGYSNKKLPDRIRAAR